MTETRMSLSDAATALGIAPNSVRSRFKAGKLRGERDNQGKIWVWLNDAPQPLKGSKQKSSKPSIEDFENGQIEALKDHLRTATEQLVFAQAELVSLRPRASAAERLEGEAEGLKALCDEVRTERDYWRTMAQQALTNQHQQPEPRRRLWARVFGRQGNSTSGE